MFILNYFANPARFLRLARAVQPWAAALTGLCLAVGLYMAFFTAPADYQQGESVRIMYVHVPSAWMAMFCYVAMAAAAAVGLIWRHTLADLAAKATAPVGASFAFLTLVTGSFWGKPMWGAWWVWDARLTSMLVLFFLYLGYIALVDAFDDSRRGLKAGAILAVVGAINVPIIKFSVDWWNTLHQPASIVRMGGPSIHPDMLWPLLFMGVGFTAYYVWVVLMRMRTELAEARIRAARLRQVHGNAGGAA